MTQLTTEFKPNMLFFSVGNGAMNAPQYWQWRNERSPMLASARWDQREYTGGYTKRMGNLSSAFEKNQQIFNGRLSLWRDDC